jgi:hypothetical protein
MLDGIVELVQLQVRVIAISDETFLALPGFLDVDCILGGPAFLEPVFEGFDHLVFLGEQILHLALALLLLMFYLFP